MTLPSSNNNPPISLSDLNAEFGLGTDLNAYRGVRWFKDDNSRGFFSAGEIQLDDFYATRVNSPVVAGSATLTRAAWNAKNYTLPMFNNLNVVAYSGQGGIAGLNGNCADGGAGGSGGSSAFGTYAVTGTGAAVQNDANVANRFSGTQSAVGRAEGFAYAFATTSGLRPRVGRSSGLADARAISGTVGLFSTASASWTITDGNQASILALYGTNVAITAGVAGTAGSAGKNQGTTTTCNQYNEASQCISLAYVYYCGDSVSGGAGTAGSPGYISVSWT